MFLKAGTEIGRAHLQVSNFIVLLPYHEIVETCACHMGVYKVLHHAKWTETFIYGVSFQISCGTIQRFRITDNISGLLKCRIVPVYA